MPLFFSLKLQPYNLKTKLIPVKKQNGILTVSSNNKYMFENKTL